MCFPPDSGLRCIRDPTAHEAMWNACHRPSWEPAITAILQAWCLSMAVRATAAAPLLVESLTLGYWLSSGSIKDRLGSEPEWMKEMIGYEYGTPHIAMTGVSEQYKLCFGVSWRTIQENDSLFILHHFWVYVFIFFNLGGSWREREFTHLSVTPQIPARAGELHPGLPHGCQ